jgi:hypothetical protein
MGTDTMREHADNLAWSLRIAIDLLEHRDEAMGGGTKTSIRVISEARALISKGLPKEAE